MLTVVIGTRDPIISSLGGHDMTTRSCCPYSATTVQNTHVLSYYMIQDHGIFTRQEHSHGVPRQVTRKSRRLAAEVRGYPVRHSISITTLHRHRL